MDAAYVVVELFESQDEGSQVEFLLLYCQFQLGLDQLLQGEALDQLHDDVTAAFVFEGSIKLARELEPRFLLQVFQNFNFPIKEFDNFRLVLVLKIIKIDNLDRNLLARGQENPSIDGPEAALANNLNQLVIIDEIIIWLQLGVTLTGFTVEVLIHVLNIGDAQGAEEILR